MSEIEWTDETFNPWWGCTKVSEGCAHCYAETWASRGIGVDGVVQWGNGKPRKRMSGKYWQHPLDWNARSERAGKRLKVFTASMADVFDDEVDPAWRSDLWELIRQCPNLDWQLLTKRPQNIRQMLPDDWEDGWQQVWLGISVENQKRADERIPILADVPCALRFLSVEPLLGEVQLDLKSVGWVICGGESGRSARVMKPEWAISVRDQCASAGVPFFFKQWGGVRKKETGKRLEGRSWQQFPKTEAHKKMRRRKVAKAVSKYADKYERLPVRREIAQVLEQKAKESQVSRREYLDKFLSEAFL